MYDVYILKSRKDKRIYTGFAADAKKRLKDHNKGKVAATRNRKPLFILYTEKCETLKEAKERERYWKSGAGRRRLRKYFKDRFPPQS